MRDRKQPLGRPIGTMCALASETAQISSQKAHLKLCRQGLAGSNMLGAAILKLGIEKRSHSAAQSMASVLTEVTGIRCGSILERRLTSSCAGHG